MQQYIDSAVEQFKTLLTQQIARQQEMEKNNEVTDYQKLDKIIIGICSGDGIGPIISKESERILNYIPKMLKKDETKSNIYKNIFYLPYLQQ